MHVSVLKSPHRQRAWINQQIFNRKSISRNSTHLRWRCIRCWVSCHHTYNHRCREKLFTWQRNCLP